MGMAMSANSIESRRSWDPSMRHMPAHGGGDRKVNTIGGTETGLPGLEWEQWELLGTCTARCCGEHPGRLGVMKH